MLKTRHSANFCFCRLKHRLLFLWNPGIREGVKSALKHKWKGICVGKHWTLTEVNFPQSERVVKKKKCRHNNNQKLRDKIHFDIDESLMRATVLHNWLTSTQRLQTAPDNTLFISNPLYVVLADKRKVNKIGRCTRHYACFVFLHNSCTSTSCSASRPNENNQIDIPFVFTVPFYSWLLEMDKNTPMISPIHRFFFPHSPTKSISKTLK